MVMAAVTGHMARVLAGQLTAHGHQVEFPVGRDPAVFTVTGLPGEPYVEVTAEDDGLTSCHYSGRSSAEAASVIARLQPAGGTQALAPTRDTLVGTWDGIAVEWHYLPPAGQPVDPAHISSVLLAHLADLADGLCS